MKKIAGPRALGVISALMGLCIMLGVMSACSNGSDDTLSLLEDFQVRLAHLNSDVDSIKGEDLLNSPSIGLSHLNNELHTIKDIVLDPEVSNAHLNDELESIKQLLAALSAQLEALQN